MNNRAIEQWNNRTREQWYRKGIVEAPGRVPGFELADAGGELKK